MAKRSIPVKVREQLGTYVYLYVDPDSNRPFYIGKGTGTRCLTHLDAPANTARGRIIRKLRARGVEPHIEILKYGLDDERALLVEQTAIDLLGLEHLTNRVRGHGARAGSRGALAEIVATLNAAEAKIIDSCVLITIRREWRPNMPLQELYDRTRSAWRISPDRKRPQYALPIHAGIVREVFEIETWVKGGATMKFDDTNGRPTPRPGRWEFVGRVAPDPVRKRYLGKSVAHLVKRGAQNPIRFVGC